MGNSLFDIILSRPIINLLMVIYHALLAINTPYALGFSIIVLTILTKFIFYPLTTSQLRASKKMQALSPHISTLKDKHKNDAKRLQEETMKLYKEHGVNPAAGCLPLLIQLPVLWALYPLLSHIVSLKGIDAMHQINKIVYSPALQLKNPWDTNFFGLPLGKNPSELMTTIPIILLVPVITALLQYIQSKMLIPVEIKKDAVKKDDFASAFQTQSLYIFPVMIGYFSYIMPIGLSLYWNTMTLFGILQQTRVLGTEGLPFFKKK